MAHRIISTEHYAMLLDKNGDRKPRLERTLIEGFELLKTRVPLPEELQEAAEYVYLKEHRHQVRIGGVISRSMSRLTNRINDMSDRQFPQYVTCAYLIDLVLRNRCSKRNVLLRMLIEGGCEQQEAMRIASAAVRSGFE